MERTHAPHFVSLPSSPQPDRADFRSLLWRREPALGPARISEWDRAVQVHRGEAGPGGWPGRVEAAIKLHVSGSARVPQRAVRLVRTGFQIENVDLPCFTLWPRSTSPAPPRNICKRRSYRKFRRRVKGPKRVSYSDCKNIMFGHDPDNNDVEDDFGIYGE